MKYLLLQSDAAESYMLYFILLIIFFIAGVFLTRWIFGIDKMLTHLKRQSYEMLVMRRVLIKIAEKQAVEKQVIDNLIELSEAETYV